MLGFIQNIGIGQIILILIIVLILFGPGKLPEVGKAMGKALRSFKDAQKGVEDDIKNVMKEDDNDAEKPLEKKTPESSDNKAE